MSHPSVTPIPSADGSAPFGTAWLPELAMGVDLAAHGYVEEELQLTGTATVWHHPDARGPSVPRTAGVPFRTRVLVRRPADPGAASGFVQVEPLHPDLDSALIWNAVHPWLLREGHAWVGVTAFAHLAAQLRDEIDPARYAGLEIPEEGQHYEIVAAAVRALVAGDLGPVRADRIVLGGMSATGSFCRIFLQEGFHERLTGDDGRPLVDGYLIGISSGGAGAAGYPPLCAGDPEPPADDPRRTVRGHGAVVFEVLSETESETHAGVTRDDSDADDDRYRLYQVAGTAHIEARDSVLTNIQQYEEAGGRRPAFTVIEQRSDARLDLYLCGALAAMRTWIDGGEPAPHGERLRVRPGTEELERDADGIALGGIRPPWVQVPTAAYAPHGTPSDECEPPPAWMPFGRPEMLARLVGTMRPFAVTEILRRYGSRAGYLRRFAAAARAQADARFLLPEDAELLIHEAPRRWRA
jgi:hypothetical protein